MRIRKLAIAALIAAAATATAFAQSALDQVCTPRKPDDRATREPEDVADRHQWQ